MQRGEEWFSHMLSNHWGSADLAGGTFPRAWEHALQAFEFS